MAEKTFDKRQNTQSRLLSGTAKIVMYLFLIALVLLSIVPFYLVMVKHIRLFCRYISLWIQASYIIPYAI